MAKVFSVDPKNPPLEVIKAAVSVLKSGGVVALPTETYYGLAVDPFSESAVQRLFRLKKRPQENPILLLLGSQEMLAQVVVEIPLWAKRLMEHFWPGPLTLVFKARRDLPASLTAGTDTVAVRLSSHPLPTRLSQAFSKPITGTSANLSGGPPATSAEEIKRVFPEVDLILDGGESPGGLPSTIVSVAEFPPRLIRPGKIPWEKIQSLVKQYAEEKV